MRRRALLASASGASGGGGQFYVHCRGVGSDTYTFTIDSQKTWRECVGLKDDTGVAEISSYEEVVPGSGIYRFHIHIHDDLYDYWYAIESDEDYNIPTPEDKIKINTTYEAFEV